MLSFKLLGAFAEALDVLLEDARAGFGDLPGAGLDTMGQGVLFGANVDQ